MCKVLSLKMSLWETREKMLKRQKKKKKKRRKPWEKGAVCNGDLCQSWQASQFNSADKEQALGKYFTCQKVDTSTATAVPRRKEKKEEKKRKDRGSYLSCVFNLACIPSGGSTGRVSSTCKRGCHHGRPPPLHTPECSAPWLEVSYSPLCWIAWVLKYVNEDPLLCLEVGNSSAPHQFTILDASS